jgi:type IV pilus assembly protein PilQ
MFQLQLSAEERYAQLQPAQTPLVNYTESNQTAIQPETLGMQGRISLDLRNIEVVDALKFLSMKAGINIITTKAVSGRVTLMVEDVPIQDVFDIMLRSNSLAYDRRGEIYNVMTENEYSTLYGKEFADVRQVHTFRLKYAIPEQVFSLLDMLKSDIGRVLVDTESGNVLIMDSPEKIEIMQEALRRFEQKNLIEVFQLNYAKAKEVEEGLRTQLDSKKVGLIKADERSNQVIVQTLPERMQQIKRLINLLDKKTKEIIIDAQIIKVKLSDDLDTGVEWEGLFDIGRKYGLTYLGSYPFSAVQASTDPWRSRKTVLKGGTAPDGTAVEAVDYVGSYPFSGTSTDYSAGKQSIATQEMPQEMHLGIIGKHDFDTIIKYLQTIGETRIISNPKLAVVNNQEAKIHVGEEIPYVISTTVGAGEATASVAEEVQIEDVGVLLSVVPTINEEGYVTMTLKSEISSVIEFYTTPTGNQIPIKDTSTAETTVMVKEGSTIIIGGLRKEQNEKTVKQVPLLGRIPLLGILFSQSSRKKSRTELLIILTPKLISGDILVASAEEAAVGQEGIKTIKDYSELKSEVFVPLDKKGLLPKGLKPQK